MADLIRSIVLMGLLILATAFELDRKRGARIFLRHDDPIAGMSPAMQSRLDRLARNVIASQLGVFAALGGALYLIWRMRTTP